MKIRIKDPEFFVFFSVWIIFQFNGLIDGAIIGRSGIPSWLLLVGLLLVFLYFDGKRRISFDKYSLLFLVFFILCLPSFAEYYNFFSLSVFSVVICVMIAAAMQRGWTLSFANRQLIFSVSIIIAVLSILMFAYYSLLARPVFGIDPIRPGYGYAIDRGVLLRLVGFADDPNFYVLGMVLPLLIGMSEKGLKFRKIGLLLIVLSLILTFSRSGLLAVVFGVATYYFKRVSFKVAIAGLITLMVFSVSGLFYGSLLGQLRTNDDSVVERSFSSGFDSRGNLLNLALNEEDLKPFGNGIGRAKDIIGIHSHNSYFDYIFDAGLVPFSLLILIMCLFVFDTIRSPTLISAYGVSICVGAAALSIGFHPLFLLLIMLGSRFK